MPLVTRAKLLCVLQNQEFLPVGSLTLLKVNVRIVAATHHDLSASIGEDKFREDLYYRLAIVELTVPPLRERPQVIPLPQISSATGNDECDIVGLSRVGELLHV